MPWPGASVTPLSEAPQVVVVDGALGAPARVASIAALFPQAQFRSITPTRSDTAPPHCDVLIVAVSREQCEPAARWIRGVGGTVRVIVVLHDADVVTTRLLMREGAADVLPAPVSDAALAISLERMMSAPAAPGPVQVRQGEVVAILKAGGGVGATTLAVQVAAKLAHRNDAPICVADLDLQFGAAAAYLDLPDAITLTDCLASGASIADTPFASALARHASGARLLAAPSDVTPMDSVSPLHVEALLRGLRRDTRLTLLDMPGSWSPWSYEALRLSDRIVLVTQLTVPHIQLVKRQLRLLASQHMDSLPLLLVCNAVSKDQQASLAIKAAERALGRGFDVVIPEDRKVVTTAGNEGVEVSAVRRSSAFEKGVTELADLLLAAPPAAKRR